MRKLKLVIIVAVSSVVLATFQPLFAQNEKEAEAQIRKALNDWVVATNRGDNATANKIWGPKVIGWFPGAPEFSSSAAWAVAGLAEKKGEAFSTYELKIEEVAVSGSMAAVYDVWTETTHFKGSEITVRRIIRGNELWRLQPHGEWKIVRWVSAPEKWQRTK